MLTSITLLAVSDNIPYPIPDNPEIEDAGGDHHLLIYDRDNTIEYELYQPVRAWDGTWSAYGAMSFDLSGYSLRREGYPSTDAAGLAVLPGIIRYEEVAAGQINHAMRVAMYTSGDKHVWPARADGTMNDPSYPPLGQRFRLKASFDTSHYSPKAKTILEAWKKYGFMLADNSRDSRAWIIAADTDPRWEDGYSLYSEMLTVHASDFEAVDVSSLMINRDSGQARVTLTPTPTPTPTKTPAPTPTPSPTPLPITPNNTLKIGIYAGGIWNLDYNGDWIFSYEDTTFHFGKTGDIPIAGDWNGNGKDGIAIFRPSSGYRYFDYNLDGIVNQSFRFGKSGDLIIAGDWSGNGRDRIAIFRPSTGYWYFDYNLDGIVDQSFRYGKSDDLIIAGDWNGNGRDGIAIFRPSTGYWYFDYNLDGFVDQSFRFGKSGDLIIAGDWNGNGRDGIAIFRPSTGYWYFDYNLDGIVDQSFRFGKSDDLIIAGDWNGNGRDGIAIFRPSTGYWYFDYNLDGIVDDSFRYWGSTEKIVIGNWA